LGVRRSRVDTFVECRWIYTFDTPNRYP
jgi:hypothetical protein